MSRECPLAYTLAGSDSSALLVAGTALMNKPGCESTGSDGCVGCLSNKGFGNRSLMASSPRSLCFTVAVGTRIEVHLVRAGSPEWPGSAILSSSETASRPT